MSYKGHERHDTPMPNTKEINSEQDLLSIIQQQKQQNEQPQQHRVNRHDRHVTPMPNSKMQNEPDIFTMLAENKK